MTDVKALIKKRATIKAKLTQFSSYLNVAKSCDELSDVHLIQIEYRLGTFENLYDKYDEFQTELEALVEDPCDQYTEREEFEKQYYGLVAAARELISSARKRHTGDSASEVDVSGTLHKHTSIRLPKIDLPKFNGDYHDWLEFRDTFISIIHNNNNIDKINKLHYLRASLKGSASLVVDNLDFSSNNYDAAWRLLCERFDNKRLLVNNHVQALFNIQAVSKESSRSLRHVIDSTNKNLRALSTLGQPVQHWDTLIIFIMSNKLDHITCREWEQHRNTLSDSPTLDIFINFLKSRADLLETLEESGTLKNNMNIHYNNNNINNNNNHNLKLHKSFASSSENKTKLMSCPLCQQNHFIFQCDKFKCLPVQARIKRAHSLDVCMNCLRPGHSAAKCRLGHCKYCRERHNTLLHMDNNPSSSETHNIALSANQYNSSRVVLLSTALVQVLDSEGGLHTARVLLDNGSTANFISEEFLSKLNICTFATKSKITGINYNISNSIKGCSVSLQSLDKTYKLNIQCLVLPKVSASIPNTFIDVSQIQVPSGIRLADPEYFIPSSIDILVGAEVFWGIIGANRIDLGKNMPTLHESKLGWLISGVILQANPSSSICMHADNSPTLETDLTRFWELDSISPKHNFTSEERACEKLFVDTTHRNSDGRFVVRIPLKEPANVLGDSYLMAKRRFLALERRLARDSNLKRMYVDFMTEYLELGHMSVASPQTNDSVQYYLPHHGVIKESSSTTKLRVVFDASATTTSGKSFNDIQMVGPTLQDDLLSILLRFREHKIVVNSDIEKMYRQSVVSDIHRPLQMILWRADPSHKLLSYTLNTVTYGTASAPFLATRCLIKLSEECSDPLIRFTIAHDFFVDDYLSGESTVTDTINKCRQVVTVLQSAGYNLRKWQSNSKEVLKGLCSSDITSDFVDLSDNEMSKTLGINWRCSSDTFSFLINLTATDRVTKRQILSTIAQIFDPIGLVVPCIVEAKIIMQQLWTTKCSWDEPVSENIQRDWNCFQTTLPLLNNLSIPRWVSCDSPSSIELHVFTDASERAYGACVYVRSVSESGALLVRLLTAKSKVAPLKSTTIPRLELCAALLGARLYTKVRQSLTLHHDRVTFWCDSTIVLGWLSSSPAQLKTFVRHRVSEIQDSVGSESWRYVPSLENPADLASRGLKASELLSCSLWWSGPQFLQQESDSWPLFPDSHSKLQSSLPEVINCHHADKIQPIENTISSLCARFSNFNKLQRVMAYVIRYVNKCKKQCFNSGSLTTLELNNSLNLLLKHSQQESFPDEYHLLAAGKPLPAKNKLLSLSPFYDLSTKLIRVGGRLKNSFYDYDVKHPIIMSSSHIICKLLFNMYHLRLMHAGPQLLLTTIRHHYYPIGGRSLAKRVTHQCVKCCRIKAATVQPVMGNLPAKRVHLEFPFLNTGVDYAGPIMIANRKGKGCQLIKCFICVFVCLATRAVHLELVSGLTKEAFIAALNRFIARRGKPRSITSDNGTTFVGAYNELAKLLSQNLDLNSIDPGIHFSFIPAYTPHFGGLWESAVKSTKHHLRRVLGLANLTFEEMTTCLTQVEAILNSRPLTPLSDDPSDLSPLTPAHFLIGRSLTMLPHSQIQSLNISNLERFRRIDFIKGHFWKRFETDYILWLQERTKWRRSSGELKPGTLVVIKDEASPPLMWLMGRIIQVLPGRDGIARVADIRTRKGVIRRAFSTICPLPVAATTSVEDTSTGGVC